MGTEFGLDLIHKMYDALNSKDLSAHDNYWHDDMIWHGPDGFGSIHGLEAFKQEVMIPFYAAFPDYYAKNDIEVANGDWVSATGFLTGTHKGMWMGVKPTGKPMRMSFSDFWRIRNYCLRRRPRRIVRLEVIPPLPITFRDVSLLLFCQSR